MTDKKFNPTVAQNALDTIEQHEHWESNYVTDSGPTESRIGPSRAHPIESRYSGVNTEGQLVVTAPNPFGENIAMRLENPLDAALAGCTGPFVDALSDVHYRTVAHHQYRYTEPRATADIIASTTVPDDFVSDSLTAELSTLREASLEIDSLHDRLWSVLNTQAS